VRQWTKNLLVFGAPAAAGVLGSAGVLPRVSLTFVVFCLLASGTYLINDVKDAPEDRRHPAKRHRPVASGALPARHAFIAGLSAVAFGLAAALAVSPGVFAAACAYVLLNALYTGWMRSVPVADVAAIAAMFVIRAAAGAIAAEVPISRGFLVVVSFAALFVAAGKRYADFLDPAARRSRPVLRDYSAGVLRLMIGAGCAIALGAYYAWAFHSSGMGGAIPWRELTVVPFTAVLLRYGQLVSQGRAGAPEGVLFGDACVQIAGATWLVMFVLGV
jgi:decaprenyl-phosphate phosphoribosyltransferase